MQTIAFYLPQFHETAENNKWWGKGFTEWTNVKKARPMFKNHMQPKIPQNENYYDLLDKSTIEWQTDLLLNSGIDGLCYYHYWFKDGRQILEKPAENLLEWKDIKQPFCFSWANESWIRTWSNVEGNDWNESADKLKPNKGNEDNGILLFQDYGNEDDWRQHIEYLIPFFKDERYMRYQGRPIFIFYKPEKIDCLTEMLRFWNNEVEATGLPRPYYLGTNCDIGTNELLDGVLQYEPSYTLQNDEPVRYWFMESLSTIRKKCGMNGLRKYDYNILVKRIVDRKRSDNVFPGIFVGFDDTPRRGRNGTVIIGRNPHKFSEALHQLKKKTPEGLLFVTAWNEWAEGAYLEPDEEFGDAFLDATL